MISNFAIVAICFFEMLIAYNFFTQIGTLKFNFITCMIVGTVLFESGAVINILLSNIVWLNTLYFLLTNFLFGIICFEIKFSKALFYSIILDIFNASLEFISIFIISMITQNETTAYNNNTSILLIEGSISKALYFLTCLILARFIKKDEGNIKFPVGLYFYPIVVVGSLLVFWSICAQSNISDKQQFELSIVSTLLFLSIVVLFIIYQHNIEKENKLASLENEVILLDTEKTYYEILKKQNEDLMIYAHDAKNHLAAIQKLNDNPIIADYLSKLTDQLKEYTRVCHSGNHMLDVIINKYVTECKIKEIKFTFDIRLANLRFLDNNDLVTILGNILDNALEAAQKSEKKRISLVTGHRNTYDLINVINSCDTPPVANDFELKTTKKNKKLHGIGMKSVAKAIKKYDGDLGWDYNQEEKEFSTTVILIDHKKFTNT